MVAWFLIAIGTVAFFAYIAYTGVGIVDTTGTYAGRVDTIRRIDAIATSLSSQSAAIRADGVIFAPAGVAAGSEYLLPASMQAGAITSFGAKFQYCPMGLAATTPNGTVSSNGGSYQIQTAVLNDKAYVVGGRPTNAAASDPNIIAFVIAQLSPTAAMPGCAQIVANSNGNFSAPNGIVRAVRRSVISEVDATRAGSGAVWYVTQTGRGSGQSWSDPASLETAAAAYRTSQGGPFTIRLAAGQYSLQGSALDQSFVSIAPKKETSTLQLIGSGNAVISTASIWVPGNLELRNINVQSSTVAVDAGHTFKLTDSTTGPLVLTGAANAVLTGTNVVVGRAGMSAALLVQGNASVVANNNLTLYYASGAPALYLLDGGQATLSSAAVNVQPAASGSSTNPTMFVVAPNSALNIKETQINMNGASEHAIMAGGAVSTTNAVIRYNAYTWVGIQAQRGGRLNLSGITLTGSNPAQYALAGQDASLVSGSGTIAAGTRCWYQGESSIFRYSNPGIAGNTSAVSDNEAWAALSPQPTAQEVAQYQAMRARNLDRADLRSRNAEYSGVFQCQSAAQPSWTKCADENASCALPQTPKKGDTYLVRYGLNNSWRYMVTKAESVPCTNAVFTDPLVNTVKVCQYTQ